MPNPYDLLGNAAWPTLVVSGIAAGTLMFWLSSNGGSLKTDTAPQGIVSFELRWSVTRSMKIVESWRELNEIPRARRNLRFDFLFIPAYVLTLCLSYGWLATLAQGKGCLGLGNILVFVAWSQILAGLLDVGENFCLLNILDNEPVTSSFLPRTACICATVKFCLTGIGAPIPIYTAFTEGF